MDITSYLLGKKSSGGSGGDIDWSALGYDSIPKNYENEWYKSFLIVSRYVDNWDTTRTTVSGYFEDYTAAIAPLIDTHNVVNFSYMFSTDHNDFVEVVPQYDTSNGTNFSYMFNFLDNLKYVPIFDTSKATNMEGMFTEGANKLLWWKLLNNSMCYDYENSRYIYLEDSAINNILAMCINATSYTGIKTLAHLGLEDAYIAGEIQKFPLYQDFINAGWTTGY